MLPAIKNSPDSTFPRPSLTVVDALLAAGKIDADKHGQQSPGRQFLENLTNANPEIAASLLIPLDVQDEFVGGSSLVPDQYAKLQDSPLAQQIHLRQYTQILANEAEQTSHPATLPAVFNPQTASVRPPFDPSQNLQGRSLPQQNLRQSNPANQDDNPDELPRADQANRFRQEAVIRELGEQQKLSRESQTRLENQFLQFKQDKTESLFDINMQVALARQIQPVRLDELDDQEPVEEELEIEQDERPFSWLPLMIIGVVVVLLLLIVLR